MNELTMVNNCLQLSEIHKQLHYKSDLYVLGIVTALEIIRKSKEVSYEQ